MNFLVKLQKGILIISSLLVVIGLFTAVVLRYVFKLDLFGITELLLIPTFLLYFIGGAQGSYEKSHITADIVEAYLKNEKVKNWVTVFTSLVTLIVCIIATKWTFDYISWSFVSGGKTPGWKIPYYIPHGTVLIGFILMTFYTIVHLVCEFSTAIKGTSEREEY
ncbi:TRAP transporter small permease [Schinkia azotoformans]|uniref:TRAP transporter small permease n=1 Tax=Schinkia azotoformans TaxID=1454 RepID=UPI002DB981D0|nr:TRAP transporter small permease [Schinkia azotoformans]MEC1715141.1 TRAP transporter small permease [Schinkia azotoformans]MEC1739809.1 TRAP transporter small permease [Schinkia azotoformans]MEC1745566.1 TRAP transporter small permease [Schinkia azotoformans]MEC1760051.1 TRAP transporter small permease [Schinkia azotoformans]MEC1765066.1 TRAP transporter small permease [Schinkia azotoformans]